MGGHSFETCSEARPLRAVLIKIGGRAGLLALGVLLALAAAELVLRAVAFEYRLYPSIRFGWPNPAEIKQFYKTDPDLYWVTRDFDEVLANARRTHPAVVFLGDSCTEWGTYPSKTLQRLQAQVPALSTGVRFGVAGWSSEQGLTFLRRDGLTLRPKVLTIYFGWNDHWVALGPSDPDLTLARRLRWLADRSRLAQLLIKARMGISGPLASRPNRVPLSRYRANLLSMIREAQAVGIRVVVITAPSNFVPGRVPINGDFLRQRNLRSLGDLVPLHASYVEATRQAARDGGATLCDAATAFDRLSGSHDRYLRGDGIHLSDLGDRELAALLTDCIVEAVDRTS